MIADTARCEYCGAGLLHELVRVRVEIEAEGAWTLCARCVPTVLARFANAHIEAGALLERAWRLSGDGDPT
jgi:hypothetical protein